MEVEETVIQKIRSRREAGRAKYGKTMDRDDLTEDQWLQHAQEEALDLAIYLERLMRPVVNESVPYVAVKPLKADGCHLEMWTGFVAISDKLEVIECSPDKLSVVCERDDLPQTERIALRNKMVRLWKAFALPGHG